MPTRYSLPACLARTPGRGGTGPFAPDPLLAALEDLLLPDGHGLLERVDRLPARLERGAAVRRGDRDRDARLADGHHADPVGHRHRHDLVTLPEPVGDPAHLRLRHL